MKQIIFICCIPILFILEILLLNFILEMITMPNDTTVIIGVILISADIFLNYLLIKFIIKQFKTK